MISRFLIRATKLLHPLLPSRTKKFLERISPVVLLRFFLFQRILRINCHVPWPVHPSSIVSSPHKIRRATLGEAPGSMPGCYIQAINGISLGENCWFGPNINLISANHDLLNYHAHVETGPIVIGRDCWLGAGCTILPRGYLGRSRRGRGRSGGH